MKASMLSAMSFMAAAFSVMSAGTASAFAATPQEDQVELSEAEKAVIDAKKAAILKYIMEKQNLEGVRAELRELERQSAEQTSIHELFTVSPGGVKQIRNQTDEIERARNEELRPVRQVIRSVGITPSESNPIDVITSKGYVATIVWVDQSGNPWPIMDDSRIAKSTVYEASVAGAHRNILYVEAKENHVRANAVVNLQGLDAPIILNIESSDFVNDSKVNIRVHAKGPNSSAAAVATVEPAGADTVALAIADGRIDGDWKPLHISGVNGFAWKVQDSIYIKAQDRIVLPAPIQSFTLPGGLHVTKLPLTNYVTFSANGKAIRAKLVEQKERASGQ